MGANSNFYRPGLGYGYSAGGGGSSLLGMMGYYPQQVNYPQQHSSDMLVSHPGSGYSPMLNTYSAGSTYSNDGWTIPSQHQINPTGYDAGSAGYAQQIIKQQPIIDPYGSVKGGSRSTTKK